jgi:hypothetical protein
MLGANIGTADTPSALRDPRVGAERGKTGVLLPSARRRGARGEVSLPMLQGTQGRACTRRSGTASASEGTPSGRFGCVVTESGSPSAPTTRTAST